MQRVYTEIPDVFYIEPKIFHDPRGYFLTSYNENDFDTKFIQDNESQSEINVLRGLHFQAPPYTQAKLVRVINGEIMDVIVDIRTDSPTFGKHYVKFLNNNNKHILFVPRGFAHGFITTKPKTIVQYKIDNVYAPEYERGILYNDKDLKILWVARTKYNVRISNKDTTLPAFKDCKFYTTIEYQQNPIIKP